MHGWWTEPVQTFEELLGYAWPFPIRPPLTHRWVAQDRRFEILYGFKAYMISGILPDDQMHDVQIWAVQINNSNIVDK